MEAKDVDAFTSPLPEKSSRNKEGLFGSPNSGDQNNPGDDSNDFSYAEKLNK